MNHDQWSSLPNVVSSHHHLTDPRSPAFQPRIPCFIQPGLSTMMGSLLAGCPSLSSACASNSAHLLKHDAQMLRLLLQLLLVNHPLMTLRHLLLSLLHFFQLSPTLFTCFPPSFVAVSNRDLFFSLDWKNLSTLCLSGRSVPLSNSVPSIPRPFLVAYIPWLAWPTLCLHACFFAGTYLSLCFSVNHPFFAALSSFAQLLVSLACGLANTIMLSTLVVITEQLSVLSCSLSFAMFTPLSQLVSIFLRFSLESFLLFVFLTVFDFSNSQRHARVVPGRSC